MTCWELGGFRSITVDKVALQPIIYLLTYMFIVFGASLTIFGTLLISPGLAATTAPLSDRLEEGCVSLRKASDALRQLDVGNQVATRCADYLSEISSLLDRWREYNPK
jgi:hypothetical protein